MERLSHYIVAGFILTALAFIPAYGGTALYTLEVNNRQRVSYELEIPVQHPGTLAMEAEWTTPRILTFRFEGPGQPLRRIRRSGPSPMRLEVDVNPHSPHLSEVWKLRIMGLAASGEGTVILKVEIPDSPDLLKEREEEQIIAAAPPDPEPEPWMVPKEPPPGIPDDRKRLHRAVEELRTEVVLPGWKTAVDPCRWQGDFLRYAVDWRDRTSSGNDMPAISTRRFLKDLVEVIRKVEDLRSSDDPVLAGPMPPRGKQRRAWLSLRRSRILDLEAEIDLALNKFRTGFTPKLEEETWPQRFTSCLMACERFFEERVRMGEEKALNRDLALSQWETVLAAADVMESLASLSVMVPEDGYITSN